MRHDGNSSSATSKKKKSKVPMKTTGAIKQERCLRSVMKSLPVTRKRKGKQEFSLESAAKDTIAETIAFVIQGQLTPIKPTPLPISKIRKSEILKRVPKHRFCKLQNEQVKAKENPKVQTKTAKNNVGIKKTSRVSPPTGGDKNSSPKVTKNLNSLVKNVPKKITRAREKKVKEPVREKVLKKKVLSPKNEVVQNKKLLTPKNEAVQKKLAVKNEPSRKQSIKKTKDARTTKRKSAITLKTTQVVKPRRKCVKPQNKPSLEIVPPVTTSVQIKQEKLDEELDIFPVKIKEEVKDEEQAIIDKPNVEVSKELEPVKEKTPDEKSPNTQKNKKTKKAIILRKKKAIMKKKLRNEERRKAKLIQFWNSPKRHREASLNAIAKVHCLYENESKVLFEKMAEESLIKREPPKENSDKNDEVPKKKDPKSKKAKRESYELVFTDSSEESSEEEAPVQRTLRDVPGLRAVGKHWDMHDSISSDNNSDVEHRRVVKKKVKVKKEPIVKKSINDVEKKKKTVKVQRRRKKHQPEELMDLKDMVVKKRMASLNASAILAASYSTEKKETKPCRYGDSSGDDDDSDSSAEEYFAAAEEEIDLTKNIKEEIKKDEDRKLIEVHTTPNKKVAVILNQDTDVTITGVYVNSTTRSTHHEGYCSIAGMQYRISATSHTQTAATAVATETLLQSTSSSENTSSDGQPTCSKSYTPLDALSSMQPPPGPGIHSGPPGHHIPCTPLPGHQIGSPQHRQPPPPTQSSFSSPHHAFHPPSSQGSSSGEQGYVHGYYQPAGPLITVPHGHAQPPGPQPPPLTKSVPLSDTSPSSVTSSVHQAPPPPAPSSNNGDSSDNEVIITSVTAGTKEPPPSASHQPPAPAPYRYHQYSQYSPYPYPSQYHYPTPPPPTPPYGHHEMCYSAAPPAGSYVRHPKYPPPPPSTAYHRYSYYPPHGGDIYSPPGGPSAQPSQQVVTASPVSSNGSYTSAPSAGPPPPPTRMDTYPPPPAPPTLVETYQPPPPHYYPPTYGLPTCYSHSPTRPISYINATYQPCPCPLNTCPKNGHTGPLTGESKRSNISKDAMPLPPVALALPLEPASATGPPSPARGSAGMPPGGMPPPPSPAGASYHPPPVAAPKQESQSPEATECKVEQKRKARVGKAMVRSNMQSTMLLMCNPKQDYVKREIESPKDKEELHKKEEENVKENDKGVAQIPEACQTTTCTNEECQDLVQEVKLSQTPEVTETVIGPTEIPSAKSDFIEESPTVTPLTETPTLEEPLPPCIATVAENVKVKNMKRKQSMTKDQVPEVILEKKKKMSSYKDYIKKHTNCFKISNGKRKLVSKEANKVRIPKTKQKTSMKKKLNASKEQTNNRRIKVNSKMPLTENNGLTQKTNKKESSKKKGLKNIPIIKTAVKVLDNLIAKNNIDKTIEEVVSEYSKAEVEVKEKDVKKAVSKIKQAKSECKKIGTIRRKTATKGKDDVPETVRGRKSLNLPKWSNGWTWEGKPYDGRVFTNSDETTVVRKCYPAMKHEDEGDLIMPGDCVLLKAGPRKNDLPYVAKIAALWENPDDGEMMMSLLWYYRPEHTEQGRLPVDQPDEVFASRHKDSNSVACIDDKCYVLTFNEYCRYKKHFKRLEEGLEDESRCIPLPEAYPRINKQPPSSNISPEMVFFCRKVYDFRQKRIMKNPA
ncbi:bromodomain-containing protein 4-like isoform X2 [Sitophilus oryzae]|uniref:Bromodomain-containing protein 4-like isoform X2 n=1 Tax=Sitophilus oryzae TaxID=7048 RepID=A0A6J2X3D3_SITOR|nr:bromodomain-containing protein 4-like isoform X2 [Sitophilus oryzae]